MHFLPDSAVVGTIGHVRHMAHAGQHHHAAHVHVADGVWGMFFRVLMRIMGGGSR
jgi:hypothetical protein